MRKLIYTISPPGGGKSTWAKEYIKDHPRTLRVNRDDLRFMLMNSPVVPNHIEVLITELQTFLITKAFSMGYDVLLDTTNIRLRDINATKKGLPENTIYEAKVFDLPLETLLEREKIRDKPVGEDVVKRMYEDFQTLKRMNKCKSCDGKGKETSCNDCTNTGIDIGIKFI